MMTGFLYIDPGTGSMLFSILIGACATLFFFAKALVLKLKVVFSGGRAATRDKSYKSYVIYCEDKRYYTVFLPIIKCFEENAMEITYYTSSKDDPIFKDDWKFVKAEFIGVGNAAYAKLNLLSAGIVIMSTPSLDVYQLKRSKKVGHYCHIFHSTSDATTYRLFSLDFFDSVLLTGSYQADNIRYLEHLRKLPPKDLITVGCTYLDVLQDKLDAIKSNEKTLKTIEEDLVSAINSIDNSKSAAPSQNQNKVFTVLVSPSWGPSGLLTLYGERLLDPLVATGFNIILRPHPQSYISEKQMIDSIIKKYSKCPNVTIDKNRDNIYSMEKADIMISDFSGIIYDYLFLCDKPVIYAQSDMSLDIYDAWYIKEEFWQFRVLKECGIKLEEKDFPNIKAVIENASDNPTLKAARAKAKAQGWMYQGEAGQRTFKYMKKVVEELENPAVNELLAS